MNPRLLRMSGLLLLAAAAGCEPGARMVDRAQSRNSTVVQVLPESAVVIRGCAPMDTALVALTGTVDREEHLGPPGYGETPRLDERDTVLVIVLPRAIAVCVEGSDRTADSESLSVRRLQVTGRFGQLRGHVGDEVTVFGRLFRADLGWHFTDVLIRVDSILGMGPRRSPIA